MSQIPIVKKEDTEKKEVPKVYKSIAPTTSANTKSHTSSSMNQPLQKNVPAFLNKLYSMVNDPESDDLICWADDGASFFVNRQEDFARKVLPRFFKHNKFSSFVRQLNMYGFHKVPHLQQGVLETDSESERWEFSNPHFQRNQPDLLLLVTRKKGPSADEKEISSIDLQHILDEIQSIKKHQMNISNQLQSIQRDNQVLWQETVQARERHLRHQETIDKILRFLASVFSNSDKRPAISRKRRFLLGPADGDDHEIEFESQPHQTADDQRPKKIPRQQTSSTPTTFNLDDYVNGKNDLTNLSTTLPAHLKNSTTTATSSDLADAIALNDQSKNDVTALASVNDVSNNIPQLQNLITLAQANPELFSQLTSDAFFGTSSQQITPLIDLTSHLSNTPSSIALSSASNNTDTSSPRSLNQVTNTISSISSSADALNQDIEDLGISLQALAQHLGFDPTKVTSNDIQEAHNNISIDEHVNEDDLLDMDEFLNTYGSDITPNDPISSATVTDINSATNTRSPSPVVMTPSSLSQQK